MDILGEAYSQGSQFRCRIDCPWKHDRSFSSTKSKTAKPNNLRRSLPCTIFAQNSALSLERQQYFHGQFLNDNDWLHVTPLPVNNIGEEVVVLEPAVHVHTLVVHSQGAGLDAALLDDRIENENGDLTT